MLCASATAMTCLICGVSTRAFADTKAVTAVAGNPVWTFLQIMAWLLVIVIMVVVLIRFLARRMQIPQKGSIDVLAAKQLAPNKSVQVIQVQDKRFLVGVGEQVTLLADVTDDFYVELDADAVPDRSPFAPVLADALRAVRARHVQPPVIEKEKE